MYVPSHFAETRVDVLHDLIRSYPFGTLVVLTAGGLEANHIPFEIDPEPTPLGTLRGHIARANGAWKDYSPNVDALAIFQGPHAYVSPAWYPSKKQHGKVVPTWNYAVVHGTGPLRIIEDRAWLRRFVEQLTDRHEASRSEPWKVTDAPADFIDTMTNAIIGLEVPIAQLIGKWKASQNRPLPDRVAVSEALMQHASEAATEMAQLVRPTTGG